MLGNKDFIGITHENERIRIARVSKNGKVLELKDVLVFDLPNPIGPQKDTFGDSEPDIDDDSDVFGLESDLDDLDLASELGDGSDDLTGDPEDDFDMTAVEEDEASLNEKRLAEQFRQVGKKVDIGVHIPFGRTVFQILKDIDLDSMSKKERREFILDKLRPIYETELVEEQYAWEKAGNNTLLASCNNNFDLMHLVDVADTYFDGKTHIQELLSDESIWMGLARVNYNLDENDITGLISIGAKTSRVIFMQGNNILNVLPVITEGENKDTVLNTIFSKILFELDKGELPKITRLLIVHSNKTSKNAKDFFAKQFDDVEVDYFIPNPDHLTLAEDLKLGEESVKSPVELQPYLTAIGAAWAASGTHEKEFSSLSFLPEYIKEKQKVFKLEWHGAILLLLIAFTPLFLNNMYNNKSSELRGLEQQVQILDTQIEDVRPMATMTQDLLADQARIQAEVDRILELAEYSQRWSETMRMLNHGVDDISNLWIRSIRSDEANLVVNGVSLNRTQIPEVSSLFTNANIEQVRESEIREQSVYDFSINVNNILQDIEPFLLDMPETTFDPEQLEESISSVGGPPINFLDEQVWDIQDEVPDNTDETPQASASDPVLAQNENETPNLEDLPPPAEETADNTPEPEVTVETENSNSEEETETSPTEIVRTTGNETSPYGLMGTEESILIGSYTIVLHSLADSVRAFNTEVELQDEGYKTTIWKVTPEGMRERWRIGVGQFESVADAEVALSGLPEPYNTSNFIIRIRDDY